MDKRTVAVVLFDNFAPLDVYGPVQALNMALCGDGTIDPQNQLYEVITIGSARGPVQSGWNGGPVTEVRYFFEDDIDCDILLIPGGMGAHEIADSWRDTKSEKHAESLKFIKDLAEASSKADVTATVCTGAVLLALTGLLDGKRATSNKAAWSWVTDKKWPYHVHWDIAARWVNLVSRTPPYKGMITSAGVSAGIDMALALIETINGEDGREIAERAAYLMEYKWHRAPY
jgi:transcriptional regulator GlxA family with amidase domain